MWNKSKKIISLVAAATFLGAAFTMTACNDGSYKGDKLDYQPSTTAAVSNGGFVVEKDNYVYFINGQEEYKASNKFGSVTKGALMRIAKSDLSADWKDGNYAKAETVVPMLFVSQNFDSGIYIYGDYVYYATPTKDKNVSGEVENSWIDFKRAKLDGTDTMKDYYFRLSNNAANYRFVEVDGVVYCLYEKDGALQSFNTKTKKTSVLVSGAKSSFYFDQKDLTNPNVYYTMSVEYDADSDHSSTATYDQLYCVNAADVVAKVDSKKASYTVKDGKTYDFNEKYLKAQDTNLGDYTKYPYVNLGDLVLDGIGLNAKNAGKVTQFNEIKDETPATPDGYNYTISRYENGGVYFTRTEGTKTSSDAENTKLYYLADKDSMADDWNTVDGNASDKIDVVALNTTNASSSAIFTVDNGAHTYYYLEENVLYKAGQPDANGDVEKMALAYNLSGATLWTINGDYLYYYGTGTNGNNVSRINCMGEAEDYNPLLVTEEYEPLTIAYVDWNSAWYKPEIVDGTLLYSNAQSFGSTAYDYIYAAKLGDTATLIANNEAYEEVNEFIDSYSSNSDLQKLMKYYFRTGEATAYEAAEIKELYTQYQQDEFKAFQDKVADGTYSLEKSFIVQVGKLSSKDAEAIENSWVESLLSPKEEVVDNSLPGWAIALIVVGSVLVVAAAVGVPVLVMFDKKKKAAQAEADAIVNAHKKKIDTTDDKSIDVYAEETPAEESAEEATEEAVEETEEPAEAEAVVEEPAEEVVPEEEEAPVEEAAPAEEEKTEE